MKTKILVGVALLLFIAFAWWANSPAGKEFVRKETEKEAAEEKEHPAAPDPKARLINTVWESPDLGSYDTLKNVALLSFYADSVTFYLPHGSVFDVSWLLGGRPYGKKTYYSWDYSLEGNKIVLDPGFTGFAVPVELSGDSLVWQGKKDPRFDHLAFRRVK